MRLLPTIVQMRSALGRMHGQIHAYTHGGHQTLISADCYEKHMKEAAEWNAAFRPDYEKGEVPSKFQGSPQPSMDQHPIPQVALQ